MLDTGAEISLIPEEWISNDKLDGRYVTVNGPGCTRRRKTAMIDFIVGTREYGERVALAPARELDNMGIIKVDLAIEEDREMLLELMKCSKGVNYEEKAKAVRIVKTRVMARRDEAGEHISESGRYKEGGIAKVDSTEDVKGNENADGKGSMNESFADVKGSENELVACEMDSENKLVTVEEGKSEKEAYEVDLPVVEIGKGKDECQREVMNDDSLKFCRNLADKEEQGYAWKNGCLVKVILDRFDEKCELFVVPKCKREKILELAHEKCGHLGERKVLSVVCKRFTWPLMATDVSKHCRSCNVCQRANKRGSRKSPMVERAILTMPFESLAVDIVGPFPKCKGGVRYVLTTLCLATKWPDAVPLRSVTAKAVMEGLWQIFSQMALPMSILTDQGSQLTGKLMHEVCQLMGIDKLQTTAYRPQTNGALERFHGTLNSMLTKATLEKQPWTERLPMAMFAARTFPNRDSGFSPYELVFGRNTRTPLDLLYAGWRDEVLGRYNLTDGRQDW